MKNSPSFSTPRTLAIAGVAAVVTILQSTAMAQQKLLDMRFNEGTGTSTVNQGSTGGTGLFTQQNGAPVFTNNIPTGAFAPKGNVSSVDMGVVGASDGARGIDFPASTATPTIGLPSFTVTGWINARDSVIGPGGNRIISTWPGESGRTRGGFEVVQVSNGRLRFSVNEAPDFPGPGPFSNDFKLNIDPNTPVGNWVFFAITYDSLDVANTTDGVVNYYFGNAATPAAFDSTALYDTGPILAVAAGKSGTLAIGNFTIDVNARPSLGTQSRVFRGLIDEIGFFPTVLNETQIRAVQTAPEPGSTSLLALGLAAVTVSRRRKRIA